MGMNNGAKSDTWDGYPVPISILNKHKIGLLLCHSHIELCLVEVKIEAEVEVTFSKVGKVEMRLS